MTEWCDISTAPKDGTQVLTCDGEYYHIGANSGDMGYGDDTVAGSWFEAEECKTIYPTHWMPLPNPPSEDEELIKIVKERDGEETIKVELEDL